MSDSETWTYPSVGTGITVHFGSSSVGLALGRYQAVLAAPHARALAASSFVGRLGQASISLAVLLGVHHATGSFGTAGVAVGVAAATATAGRIAQGRLIDKAGTSIVLAVAALAELVVMTGLSAAVNQRLGTVTLLVLCAGSGIAMPALAASMRTLWAQLFRPTDERTAAYALEALLTDIAFMVGPAVAGIAAAFSPSAALVLAGSMNAAGSLLVASSPVARASRGSAARAPAGDRRLAGRLIAPVGVTIGLGGAMGFIQVGVPSFASAHHATAASGLLLASWTTGSMAGGLWYGGRRWDIPLSVRLTACMVVLTLANGALALVPSLPLLAILLPAAGLPLAATLTTVYLVVDDASPAGRLTEAFAWVSSALPGGTAVGTAVGGWLVSVADAHTALAAAAGCAAVTTLGSSLFNRRLVTESAARPPDAPPFRE